MAKLRWCLSFFSCYSEILSFSQNLNTGSFWCNFKQFSLLNQLETKINSSGKKNHVNGNAVDFVLVPLHSYFENMGNLCFIDNLKVHNPQFNNLCSKGQIALWICMKFVIIIVSHFFYIKV